MYILYLGWILAHAATSKYRFGLCASERLGDNEAK